MKRFYFKISNNYCIPILLTAIGSIAFLPFLGNIHLFDWDEINFAEAAREMLVTGNYSYVQINFEPFYEKPPLFFWLQVISMKLWGINEFAARFPNAIFGIITLLTIYFIGKKYKDNIFGFLWAFMHLSSLLSHFYFKTGIIDPIFNYLIFIGIYCISQVGNRSNIKNLKWTLIGGISIGLAVLTKGPVGWLLPGLTIVIYWMYNKCKPIISCYLLVVLVLAASLIPSLWLAYETSQRGFAFVKSFILYQVELFSQPVAGHAQPFYYHFLVVFLGCFPASVLALGNSSVPKFSENFNFLRLMQIVFWVVMILFSLATTKILHYSSMAYFPVSFLAAYYLYAIDKRSVLFPKWMRIGGIGIGILVSVLLLTLPIAMFFKQQLYRFITDKLFLESLKLTVSWSFTDCLVGISYLIAITIAYFFFLRRAILYFVVCCSLATTISLFLGVTLIIPKVEAHIQRSAIDFYKSLSGKDVYVTTVGFKSYAPFFYAQIQPKNAISSNNIDWLFTGTIDKPAYFVIKRNNSHRMLIYPDIDLIKQDGQFSFFIRK